MKRFSLIFLLIFLLLPLVFAVEFNLKESFSQGETIITKVSGNFLSQITRENVFFYREHVRVPIDYGSAKIDDDYYIYAILTGKSPGNYSISLENVKYMKGSEVVEGDIVKNFTITNSTADFSLKPGVVIATDDFFVEVQNLLDEQITIDVKTQTSNSSARDIFVFTEETNAKEAEISVKSGEIKRIYFKLGSGAQSFQDIEFSSGNFSYELPVYISESLGEKEAEFKLEPSELILSIPTNSVTKRTIYLYNTGSREIENISLSLSDELSPFVSLSQESINKLEANSNVPIELSLFSPGETEVSGNLKVNLNREIMLYSQISLKFLNNYTPTNESQSSVKTCAELGGKICTSNEKCSQQTIYAKDNVCCPGTCESTEKRSPAGVIIAIVILVVIAGGLFWFYKKKYKKAKRPVDLLKIAKSKK
jgi:hypothetical protein